MKILTIVATEKEDKVESIEVVGNLAPLAAVQLLILYDREMFLRAQAEASLKNSSKPVEPKPAAGNKD